MMTDDNEIVEVQILYNGEVVANGEATISLSLRKFCSKLHIWGPDITRDVYRKPVEGKIKFIEVKSGNVLIEMFPKDYFGRDLTELMPGDRMEFEAREGDIFSRPLEGSDDR